MIRANYLFFTSIVCVLTVLPDLTATAEQKKYKPIANALFHHVYRINIPFYMIPSQFFKDWSNPVEKQFDYEQVIMFPLKFYTHPGHEPWSPRFVPFVCTLEDLKKSTKNTLLRKNVEEIENAVSENYPKEYRDVQISAKMLGFNESSDSDVQMQHADLMNFVEERAAENIATFKKDALYGNKDLHRKIAFNFHLSELREVCRTPRTRFVSELPPEVDTMCSKVKEILKVMGTTEVAADLKEQMLAEAQVIEECLPKT